MRAASTWQGAGKANMSSRGTMLFVYIRMISCLYVRSQDTAWETQQSLFSPLVTLRKQTYKWQNTVLLVQFYHMARSVAHIFDCTCAVSEVWSERPAWEGRWDCLLCEACWPLQPLEEPCPRIRAGPPTPPWERKRPGFRPNQHLWKCSRVTATKSTCQH